MAITIDIEILMPCALHDVPVILIQEGFTKFLPKRMTLPWRSLWVRLAIANVRFVIIYQLNKAAKLKESGFLPSQIKQLRNLKLSKSLNSIGSLPPQRKTWLAASLNSKEIIDILQAHLLIRNKIPGVRLIICPRDITSGHRVTALVEKVLGKNALHDEVVLNDTFGVMDRFYSQAHVVFVGGTLFKIGGHNILEPMAFGKPTLVGPHTSAIDSLIEACAKPTRTVIKVQNSGELAEKIIDLLENDAERERIGAACKQALKVAGENVLEDYLDLICPILDRRMEEVGIETCDR